MSTKMKTKVISDEVFDSEFLKILREIMAATGIKYFNLSKPDYKGLPGECIFYCSDVNVCIKLLNKVSALWFKAVLDDGRIQTTNNDDCPQFAFGCNIGEFNLRYMKYLVDIDSTKEIIVC